MPPKKKSRKGSKAPSKQSSLLSTVIMYADVDPDSKAFDEHCWAHLGVAKATFQEDMRDPDCTALIAKCKRGRPRVVKPGPPRAPAAYIQADHNNARQAGLYVLSVAELRSTSVNKTI
jgi:hypothetical protein